MGQGAKYYWQTLTLLEGNWKRLVNYWVQGVIP